MISTRESGRERQSKNFKRFSAASFFSACPQTTHGQMSRIPAWPSDFEIPLELIKPQIDVDQRLWSPVAKLQWGIGFQDVGNTPHLQLAIVTASLLLSGALRYDSGIRAGGTRLRLDVNWDHGSVAPELDPAFRLEATLNDVLRMDPLIYESEDGLFSRTGDASPGRNFIIQTELHGQSIPACWSFDTVLVILEMINPKPPLPLSEIFRKRPDCE